MRLTLTHTAIAAALLYTSVTHAAVPTIETAAFTLQDRAGEPWAAASLIEEGAGSVRIALTGMAAELRAHGVDSGGQPNAISYATWANSYDVTVNAGYRVTGITLSATLDGALMEGQGDTPGLATNFLRMSFGLGPATYGPAYVQNFTGYTSLAVDATSLSLSSPFALDLNAYVNNYAESALYYDSTSGNIYWNGSSADIGLGDVMLTVNVAAVPEPQTWLMLGAGLGALALMARRRRSA
jgi:PEP-CTERM motif